MIGYSCISFDDMRKLIWIMAAVLCGAAIYFVTIPYEVVVTLHERAVPGDIIETIRIWNKSIAGKIDKVNGYENLTQRITVGDKTYRYKWYFKPEGDSLTRIRIQISEPNRRLINKLLVPFSKQPIETDAQNICTNFRHVIKQHMQITRVEIVGEVELDPVFCLCSSVDTVQTDKAFGMMRDYPLLTTFVSTHGLTPNGVPMIRATFWDHDSGRLSFQFCLPIVKKDSLPDPRNLQYEDFSRTRALKAEYFGNYITSDRGWYELLEYAAAHDYNISHLPIEYFHHNPNLGFGETEWKAEVYFPLIH
jgi:hypothetical protein